MDFQNPPTHGRLMEEQLETHKTLCNLQVPKCWMQGTIHVWQQIRLVVLRKQGWWMWDVSSVPWRTFESLKLTFIWCRLIYFKQVWYSDKFKIMLTWKSFEMKIYKFTFYSLVTSVYIFSILFSIHFLRCCQGEFVKQSRGSLVCDHFLSSWDLNVWLRGDIRASHS